MEGCVKVSVLWYALGGFVGLLLLASLGMNAFGVYKTFQNKTLKMVNREVKETVEGNNSNKLIGFLVIALAVTVVVALFALVGR